MFILRRFITVFCIIAIISSSIFLTQVFSNDTDCEGKLKNLEDAQKAFNTAFRNYARQKARVDTMKLKYAIGKQAQKDLGAKKLDAEIDRLQYFSDVATEKLKDLEAAKKALEQICNLKHGVSGETGVIYYSCEPDTSKCPRSSEHWVPCRGGCGELFPPPKLSVHLPAGLGSFGFTDIEYYDHEVVCEEPVYSFWNPNEKCGKKYFTCRGGCSHRASEGVFYNKTVFQVYETLSVRVLKDDLYYVALYINGKHAKSTYADSNGQAVLRHTWHTGHIGVNTVTIYGYYERGAKSFEQSSTVTVE